MAVRAANASGQYQIRYNPYQIAFHRARRLRTESGKRCYTRLVAIAGRQSGKTAVCGAISAVEEASIPNTTGWCCAPSYPELYDYVIPAVMRVLPSSWIKPGKEGWSEEHKELSLINGSRIKFRSLDDPERGRGDTLDWVWLDEACKIQEKAWDYLEPALIVKDGIAIFTSSPRSFDWVYNRCYKPAIEGKPGYFAVKYKTSDNPLPGIKAAVARRKATTDPKLFAQEYEGDFVIFAGAIYADYMARVVLADSTPYGLEQIRKLLPEWPQVDPTWKAIVGLDPGADHPFAATLDISTPRGLVQIGEYRERNRPVSQHAAAIKQMVAGLGSVTYAIDRSAKQMQIELAQHGIFATQAENAVTEGIHRVQSWMSAGQYYMVESRCPRTIEEMASYQWAETTTGDGEYGKERPKKERDDLMDAKRYGLMTWPHLPKALDVDVNQIRRDQVALMGERVLHDWDREQRANRKPAEDLKRIAENPLGDFAVPMVDGSEYEDRERNRGYEADSFFEEMCG